MPFNLFLRARWEEKEPSMQVDEDGEVSVAFWLDGPLASAVVSKLPPEETKAIAETVRKEIRGQNAQVPIQSIQPNQHDGAPKDPVFQTTEDLFPSVDRPSPTMQGNAQSGSGL